MTASPEQLVVMLYENAIRNLKQAADAIEIKDLATKGHSIDRALAIVQHLQTTLDIERGGTIAAELDRIYTYVISRILDGSNYLRTAPLKEAVKLLRTLLASWETVAMQNQRQRPTVATTAMVC